MKIFNKGENMNIEDISTEDLLAEIVRRINHTPDAVDPQPLTTFDFKDGNGPVLAHPHTNGGGWVADTANVDATAYVGPNAQVYGDARVYGNTQISGKASVSTGLVKSTAPKEQA